MNYKKQTISIILGLIGFSCFIIPCIFFERKPSTFFIIFSLFIIAKNVKEIYNIKQTLKIK